MARTCAGCNRQVRFKQVAVYPGITACFGVLARQNFALPSSPMVAAMPLSSWQTYLLVIYHPQNTTLWVHPECSHAADGRQVVSDLHTNTQDREFRQTGAVPLLGYCSNGSVSQGEGCQHRPVCIYASLRACPLRCLSMTATLDVFTSKQWQQVVAGVLADLPETECSDTLQ
jgi:hypothetical protein